MLWLKWCIVTSLPKEAIAIDVEYPAVLLAHCRSLWLFPAIVFSLLNSLRELHSKFSKVEAFVNDEGETVSKTPNPQVELPYTYMMVWFVLHCLSLMMAPNSEESASLPYVKRHENSDWMSYYISTIPKTHQSHQSCQIYHSFLKFPGGNYADEFKDIWESNTLTMLFSDCF